MTRCTSTVASSSILLICATLAFLNAIDLLGMEFGGGSLTGVLVRLCLGGSALFVLRAVLALWNRRLIALPSAFAAAACLPLYIQLIAPHALEWLSNAPSSVQAPALLLNGWPIAGLLSLMVLGFTIVADFGRAQKGPAPSRLR